MPIFKTPNQSFRWLAAELIVVVLGVLIALAVSSWYENYQDVVLEKEILTQFQASLTNQKVEIEERISRYNNQEIRIQTLLDHMNSGEPYNDELDNYFGAITAFIGFQMDLSAYELLKSKGLYLISNDDLRSDLVTYYEIEYPGTHDRSEMSEEISRTLAVPFLNKHLIRLQGGGWKPIDYEALRNNVEIHNLAIGRLARIRTFISSGYDRSQQLIDDILNLIESELE